MGRLMSAKQNEEREQEITEAREHDIVTRRVRGILTALEYSSTNAQVQESAGAWMGVIASVQEHGRNKRPECRNRKAYGS